MGSLSDSDNIGARPVAPQHYYGARRAGPGRWATLFGVGILWTDDVDALQLSRLDDADRDQAFELIKRLHALAAENFPAAIAFDRIVSEYGASVASGELSTITA